MSGFARAWSAYGPLAMGATIALLAVFYLLRGRVRIEKGWAGLALVRFGRFARLAHWLLAISFIVLALSGLALRHGPALLAPAASDQLRRLSLAVHGPAAYAFTVGLAIAFLIWIRHSLPHWRDVVWLLKGGGILLRGVHPGAWRFNTGQKLLFWLCIIGGSVLILTGITLTFPSSGAFSQVLSFARRLGIDVPAELTSAEEAAEALAWHVLAAYFMICVVIVHVYMRTLGIQGSFSAMGSGQVDANWARQHHRLWAEREIGATSEDDANGAGSAKTAPAE